MPAAAPIIGAAALSFGGAAIAAGAITTTSILFGLAPCVLGVQLDGAEPQAAEKMEKETGHGVASLR